MNINSERSEVKFTIVIPTRERCDTLVHTITSVLAQDYKNYEILISDNASQDNTLNTVSAFNDNRIRYINTGVRVSMSHNWEFALEQITDGWVTFLGDDDALLPGALKKAESIIRKTGTLALRSNGCGFTWPNSSTSDYGSLSVRFKRGYRQMNSQRMLEKVMKGDCHYNLLPMLYNGGFIDFSLIKRAKDITHRFYLSRTPDVYSGLVFAMLTDEYVYSNEPLAINGASHHSGGTALFQKMKTSHSYDPGEKYLSENNIKFHEALPLLPDGAPVRSLAVFVYEAYLQAAPFHQFKKLTVSPEQQLSLILLTSSPHTAQVLVWGKIYAQRHRLSFEKISRANSSLPRLFRQSYNKIIERLKVFLFTWIIYGRPSLPLRNVYEASLVVGVLRDYPPKFVTKILNLYSRLHAKLKYLYSKNR